MADDHRSASARSAGAVALRELVVAKTDDDAPWQGLASSPNCDLGYQALPVASEASSMSCGEGLCFFGPLGAAINPPFNEYNRQHDRYQSNQS